MRRAVPDVEVKQQEVGDGSLSRRALLGAGALGAVVTVPVVGRLLRLGDALGSPSKAQDVKILQLVLQLEYTQVAFYEDRTITGNQNPTVNGTYKTLIHGGGVTLHFSY